MQVHENLLSFGDKLRGVFQRVQAKRLEGNERTRIFMKIKESLDDELMRMRDRVSTINKVKVDLEVDWKNEMDAQAAANKKEEERIAKEQAH